MKRIVRQRRLTTEEGAKYKGVREQIAEELRELIARHHKRMANHGQLPDLSQQQNAAPEANEGWSSTLVL